MKKSFCNNFNYKNILRSQLGLDYIQTYVGVHYGNRYKMVSRRYKNNSTNLTRSSKWCSNKYPKILRTQMERICI